MAVYGRRRIGKTFLVREFFSSKGCYFELAGKQKVPIKQQLKNFAEAFSKTFYSGVTLIPPRSWGDALSLLTAEMGKNPSRKYLLFFDELPWLASKKAGFIQALDHAWNSTWSRMANVKVIVCGSAAGWMLEHLIHAKGGLHNRITRIIHLQPLNLRETGEYLRSRSVRLNEKQLLDLYMVMGGVPYYLNFVEKGKSAEQNIQEICFSNNGPLLTEFDRLYRSLFASADLHLRLIRAIAAKREGVSREDLLSKVGGSSGGTFNKKVKELEAAGFIRGFIPYGNQKKNQYFRLIDEYSAFYLTWIDPVVSRGFIQVNYWKSCLRSASWAAWAGYAFESVCFKHLPQILSALHLKSIPSEIGSFRWVPKKGVKEKGVQVDLLFDRQDQTVTMCEIKYSSAKYLIDKAYAKDLQHKIEVLQEKTSKQVFLALISTLGVKKNLWSEELVDSEVTLKDLFG